MNVNLSNAGPVYIKDVNVVIIVPADGLAPHGARPSAGTVMITKLYFLWLSKISNMFLLIRRHLFFKMANEI